MESKPPRPATIDEYIAACPEEVQPILRQVRAVIHRAAPGLEEKISYGMPGFFLGGRSLVWFAANKRALGFYPRTQAVDAALGEQIEPYKTAKSSLNFPYDRPIPYEVIEQIVKIRAGEKL